MAIIKAVNSKASIGKAIKYITQEEKTEEKIIAGKDCNIKTSIDEMKAIKELYNKTEGRQYKHYVMSFNPNDPNINIEKAHQVGKEFMENEERFKNHQVIMATHTDKRHIHNHFIVNSVNMENGKKFRESKYDLEKLKDHLRKLEKKHNLLPDEKSKEQGKISSLNHNKYQAIKRDIQGDYKSYILETAKAVKRSQEKAISKDDFIKEMDKEGYNTNWIDTRKHITFINKESGKRVRLANLEKTFNDSDFTKGGLISEFERNYEERERAGRAEGLDIRNKGIKPTDEELYQGSNGQGLNEPSNSLKGDTSHRKLEQESTRADDFDIEGAKEHIRRSTRENAKSVTALSKPDARTREIEREKARELERANSRKHERGIESSKSRDQGISR
ncbi:MAG: relaxase/mobilization nuclease domain-containing protein [Clostridium sp.]|nr:relaxase/mobilization nuclease domain-containing protein [Clostridium sp.]